VSLSDEDTSRSVCPQARSFFLKNSLRCPEPPLASSHRAKRIVDGIIPDRSCLMAVGVGDKRSISFYFEDSRDIVPLHAPGRAYLGS
jgi:hypothetical protein